MTERRTALLLSAILFLTLLPGIHHGLWRPDEPQVAGVCAGMAYEKDFVVPRLNGDPFLEKPPLYYALGGLSGIMLGKDNDVAYRLVSMFFAALTLVITFFAASIRGGKMNGLLASGVLASSMGFFHLARWIQVDMSLVFSVTLALFAYIKLCEKSTRRHALLMGFAVGLSFMAKGSVGPAIIVASVVTDIVLKRSLTILKRMKLGWILAVALVTILPWILALYARGGFPFLREVIVVNNIMRFTGAPEGAALGHMKSPFFYLMGFPQAFLPWIFAFVPAFISSIRKAKDDPYLAWFIGPFILLSIAAAKRELYLNPLYPACACMIALWLSRAVKPTWERFVVKGTWGIAVLGAFVPFAGVFFGGATLGILSGLFSLACLYMVSRWRARDALGLVMVMCLSLTATTTVWYSVMKEKRDYLGFTREALSVAKGSEIIVLAPDEIFEGTLPMVTGKACRVMAKPTDVKQEGLYIWADKDDIIIREVKRIAEVKMLLDKKLGNRPVRLAFIKPNPLR